MLQVERGRQHAVVAQIRLRAGELRELDLFSDGRRMLQREPQLVGEQRVLGERRAPWRCGVGICSDEADVEVLARADRLAHRRRWEPRVTIRDRGVQDRQ